MEKLIDRCAFLAFRIFVLIYHVSSFTFIINMQLFYGAIPELSLADTNNYLVDLLLQIKIAVKDFERETFSNLTQDDMLIILCTGKHVIFVGGQSDIIV